MLLVYYKTPSYNIIATMYRISHLLKNYLVFYEFVNVLSIQHLYNMVYNHYIHSNI